ncbi:MAG: ROK family protein [Phycisphaerales bacterium]
MRSLGIDIGGTSVKLALLDGDRVATSRSIEYSRPSADALEAVLAAALPAGSDHVQTVGLCVPGRLDPARTHIVQSINLPSLENVPLAELISRAIRVTVRPFIASDAHAAAHDFWSSHRPVGRLLAISIGTGVGASVLDEGRPLLVSGETPGHFGQIDVTLDPNSGPRTLEAYVGAKAIRSEFGEDVAKAIATLGNMSPPLRALARGLRIAHAIYRPDTVALLGFVGMQFAACRTALDAMVRTDLTAVANPDWKLAFGTSPFHAAIGAARLGALRAD